MERIDEAILVGLADWRSPLLTRVMMDVGSFGSPTVTFLIAAFAFAILWGTRNQAGALRIVAATGGAEIWIEILKRIIGRPRPELVPYLVQFTGLSFPSGHAMAATATYATIAAVVSLYLRDRKERIAIWSICTLVIVTVSISRVYLGVHYPTDVAGGVLFGLGWFYFLGFAQRHQGSNAC
jgi:undecaprenyl-diphosphatase